VKLQIWDIKGTKTMESPSYFKGAACVAIICDSKSINSVDSWLNKVHDNSLRYKKQ